MAATLRAVRALALLAGFYVLGTVLLAVLATVDVLIVRDLLSGHIRGLLLWVLGGSLLLTLPILDGMFVFGRQRPGDGPAGRETTPGEQPELWAQVRESAGLAGTRAPDRLVLTGDVNAAVAEHTRLLGLVPGRRSLYLGVPLLAGLSEPRLRAVLAHEFGHYGHHDTRLSAITMRGRVAIVRTIEAFRQGAADGGTAQAVVGNLYVRYGRMYMRASQSVARGQELAADRVAALSVGRDTTAGALREADVLDDAFALYLDRYATAGAHAGLLPPAGEFYGGFGRLLAEAGGAEEVVRAAGGADAAPAQEHSPYDSHPPMAERVRLIRALPDDGRGDDPSAPAALALLRDPARVLAEVEAATLSAETAAMRRLPWDELARSAGWAAAAKAAEPLRAAVYAARPGDGSNLPTVEEVLDAVEEGAPGTRDLGEAAVRDGLAALVHLALAHAGRARWSLSWTPAPGSPIHLTLPPAVAAGLPAALSAACAAPPSTGALRELLADAGAGAPAATDPTSAGR